MIDGAVRRTVRSGEVELALIEAGDPTRPTIVLVHGYPDTKELWHPIIVRLSPRFHVVAYDVRGAGASSAPRGPAAYSFERLADDLLVVLDSVGGRGPVHLVGHDWGGIAGWELAAMPRVERRIASFTTIAGPSLAQLSVAVRRQLGRGRLLDVLGRLRRSWYVLGLCTPGVPTLTWRGVYGGGRWRKYLQFVERVPVDAEYPTPALERTAIHGSNLYRRNILLRLGSRRRPEVVNVPVQLITPTGDRFISPKYYEDADRYAVALRRRIVPGSHWAPRSQPDALARWIGEFVEDVERGSPTTSRPWRRGGGSEQIDGRLALITGAGSGIGRATALALAAQGARVLIVDRDGGGAARTAEQIGDAHAFTCDVSDQAAMEQMAASVLEDHGVPDILVNNAGIAVVGTFLQTEFEDWRRVIDVNLLGVVNGSLLFGEAMADRGAGGQIVNVASAAAFHPSKDLTAYHAAKAGVLMLSECMRAELVAHGIGVTAVCPGVVATNITRSARFAARDPDEEERLRAFSTRAFALRNFPPERVAAEIVRAIGDDTPVAVVTPEAKLLRWISRVSPGMTRRLARVDMFPF